MFGAMGARRLTQQMYDAKALPCRDVTREEFVAAMVAVGETPEKAEFKAKISVGLGNSFVVVGAEKLRIVAK